MNLDQFPAPWPPKDSMAYSLARFLVSNSRRYGGKVSLLPFYEANPNVDANQVTDLLANLRKRYRYYCRKTSQKVFVDCALDWPLVTRTARVYDKRGNWTWAHSDPIGDSRLSVPVVVTHDTPDRYSILYKIFTYILRHRSPGSHELDASFLYQTYGGAKRVQSRFSNLNKKYGFRIRKKNVGSPDRIWVIDRVHKAKR